MDGKERKKPPASERDEMKYCTHYSSGLKRNPPTAIIMINAPGAYTRGAKRVVDSYVSLRHVHSSLLFVSVSFSQNIYILVTWWSRIKIASPCELHFTEHSPRYPRCFVSSVCCIEERQQLFHHHRI